MERLRLKGVPKAGRREVKPDKTEFIARKRVGARTAYKLRRGDVETFGSSGDFSNNTLVASCADVFGLITCSSATCIGEKRVTSPSTSA